jgi:hypothetical protein
VISRPHRPNFKVLGAFVALALTAALTATTASSAQKITAGATCKKLNAKATYANKSFTCIKKNGKLV